MSDRLTDERWALIGGFPDYEVSDCGRVRNVGSGRILAQAPTRSGHLRVRLSREGAACCRSVHGLVAEAFIGPRADGMTVNHRDFDPANNHWTNLEYLTRGENTRYSWNAGRIQAPTPQFGESHPNAVLTEEQVLLVRQRHQEGAYARALAREFGVSQRTVQFVVCGLHWSHLPVASGDRVAPKPPVLTGEKHGCSKLRECEVVAIRQRCAAGEPRERLANEYGVSLPAVDKVVNRRTWKHV